MEINMRYKRLTEEDRVKIVNDYNARMPIKDIMSKYKVARRTIYRTLKMMGQKNI